MQAAICIIATLFTYQGMVVLPHDPATGLVGISPTSGVVHSSTTVKLQNPPTLVPGQIVSVSEDIRREGRRTDRFITDVRVVGHGRLPTFTPVTAKALNSGKATGQFVSFRGVVQDISRDDTDDRFVFASISDGDGLVFWAGAGKDSDRELFGLIGAEVEASGVAVSGDFTARRNFGPSIVSTSMKSLAVLSRPAKDLFDAPDIADIEHAPPSDIAFYPRHRTSGQVLSVLDSKTFLLLRAKAGDKSAPIHPAFEGTPGCTDYAFTTVHLAFEGSPGLGDFVDVVGYPESDLYTINLARAAWRKSEKPAEYTTDSLFREVAGIATSRAQLHGKLMKIRGIVRRLPLPDDPVNTMLVESDGHFLEVSPGLSPSLFDGLEIGSTIAVTGIAFIEKEHWRPHLRIPRILQTTLVPRGPEDIEVLSGPPFWTPTKFLALIAALVAAVVVALLRNQTIRRLSEERVNERTRLAAELHDTIAQNLTGAAIQLETAEALASNGPAGLKRILASAVKIMHVSREELRDCIWDLRNQTLDEKRVEDALRRTLLPHLCGTRLRLRFPVNRADISDSTAHAAVSITRELVSNAIYHGRPGIISIAGTLEGDTLKFSVSDDGDGFDVDHAPGPRDGHFGLSGIRERVRKLGGTFVVKSTPGNGTKATITLPR